MKGFRGFIAGLPRWSLTLVTLATILWLTLAPKPLGEESPDLFPCADKLVHAIMFGFLLLVILIDRERSCNISGMGDNEGKERSSRRSDGEEIEWKRERSGRRSGKEDTEGNREVSSRRSDGEEIEGKGERSSRKSDGEDIEESGEHACDSRGGGRRVGIVFISVAAILVILFGITIEELQGMMALGRSYDVGDIYADAAGTVAVASGWMIWGNS